MDRKFLTAFDESLARCEKTPAFFDRFYEIFLASSPMIPAKFSATNFERQKEALRLSLHSMAQAAGDEQNGPSAYLDHLADRHSRKDLKIGAEFYDLWLDSLLQTVKESDPECTSEVLDAWERVMGVGIAYMLSRY